MYHRQGRQFSTRLRYLFVLREEAEASDGVVRVQRRFNESQPTTAQEAYRRGWSEARHYLGLNARL